MQRKATLYLVAAHLYLCYRLLEAGSSGMAIQEFGIPTGFEADLESISGIKEIKRTETEDRKVVLYFDEVRIVTTSTTATMYVCSPVYSQHPIKHHVSASPLNNNFLCITSTIFLLPKIADQLPSGCIAFIQRRINVDATSCHCIDIDSTLSGRCVPDFSFTVANFS